MSGAGFQPAGASPAGYGAPTQSATPSSTVLPDSLVVGSQGSRRIDPLTKDYVFTDGQLAGMNNVQQLVYLAIANAAPEFQKLDKLDASFEKGVRAALTAALAPLVAQRVVEITGVQVRMNAAGGLKPGQAVTTLLWRDLTTNEEQSETIG